MRMYTFSFAYVNVFGYEDTIQFCAPNYDEAEELFNDWCIENNVNAQIEDYEVVFEESDADYYGTDYGTPEQYALMAA